MNEEYVVSNYRIRFFKCLECSSSLEVHNICFWAIYGALLNIMCASGIVAVVVGEYQFFFDIWTKSTDGICTGFKIRKRNSLSESKRLLRSKEVPFELLFVPFEYKIYIHFVHFIFVLSVFRLTRIKSNNKITNFGSLLDRQNWWISPFKSQLSKLCTGTLKMLAQALYTVRNTESKECWKILSWKRFNYTFFLSHFKVYSHNSIVVSLLKVTKQLTTKL